MSFRRYDLFIQEEILLLALKDDKGTFYMRTILPALGGAIFGESLEIEPRTVVLMALAKATDLLSIPFPRKELSSRNCTDNCSFNSNIQLRNMTWR